MLAADPDASNATLTKAAAQAWDAWSAAEKYHHGLHATAKNAALSGQLRIQCGTPEADLADRHPEWLNCRNGTVDLRTGLMKPHDPRT